MKWDCHKTTSNWRDWLRLTLNTPFNQSVDFQLIVFLRYIWAFTLSVYLDYYLKLIVHTLPSYIKDTDDFLGTVEDPDFKIPPDSILVTMDVQSLYTVNLFISFRNSIINTISHYPDGISAKLFSIWQQILFTNPWNNYGNHLCTQLLWAFCVPLNRMPYRMPQMT